MTHLRPILPALALAIAGSLGACTQSTATSDDSGQSITVESSADACDLSTAQAPSGSLTFVVMNTGDAETEFYLYADGGDRIVGEVEDIGPGVTRELVVSTTAGEYIAACKPGMVGDGIRVDFTVTD